MNKKSSAAAVPCSAPQDSTRTPIVSSSVPSVGQALALSQELVQHIAAQQQLQQGRPTYPASKRTRSSFDKKAVMAGQMQPQETKKIGFIGAGNMARALAEGWISAGIVKPAKLIAIVRTANSPNIKPMRDLGVTVSTANYDVIGECDIIIIAVKPKQTLEVMDVLHKMLRTSQTFGNHVPKSLRPLIISVAACVPLAEMEKRSEISWQIGGSPVTGHLPIIRCLPNISCSVQSGVAVYTRGRFCNEEDLGTFVSLFSMLGHCEEVEEKYMDGFTALTGSGLAFMELALEAMADGGVIAGIPHPLALRMSAHTMIGSANLVLKKNQHPAQIKNAVASPAGTTVSGLLALEKGGFRAAMMSAVKAATDRATELSQS